MSMRSKFFRIAALATIISGGSSTPWAWRGDNTAVPKRKTKFKYTPPRSMTPEEKEYYDKHKTLARLYKS